MFESPISDRERVLTRKDQRVALASLQALHRRFPQVHPHLVVKACPQSPSLSPACYLFWLFNRGGFSAPLEKGGTNLHLLLWIDPERPAVRCTIGYGLEPWVAPTVLTEALQVGAAAIMRQEWGTAVERITTELSIQLSRIARTLPRTLGWFSDQQWIDLDEDVGAALSERTVSVPY